MNLLNTAWLISVFIFFCISCNQELKEIPERPNVILILTDDQGYGDLSLHGNDSLNTPNIDFLGNQGVQFERFYVSPVCAPTRASLLTGRYHLRTGVYWVTRGAENMDPGEKTIAEIFSDNGYKTGCFGKWHNGAHYPYTPNAQGFDEFIGFKAGHWSNYFNTELDYNDDTLKTEGYITDVLTEKALSFIRKNREDPFFCYIPYNAPHTPYQVPDTFYNRFINRLSIGDTAANIRRSTIYGMCENIDLNVGRIIREIDQMGMSDRTIFVFMTDNGPNGDRFNGYMRGKKGSVHEGGVRVPCFFYWKDRITGGKKIDGAAAHIDILPTLVNLCGLEFTPENPLDGIDLSEYLLSERETRTPDRKIYNHQNQGSTLRMFPGAIRDQKYRFVISGQDRYSLFDMEKDSGEKNDISGRNPDLTEKFYADYVNWFNEVSTNISTERRIPIGYRESPVTCLPAHEAKISNGLAYKADINGWAHDWIVNWDQQEDTITWNIQVAESGEFEFILQYNTPAARTGSIINVSAGDQSIRHELSKPFYSEILPHHDRWVRQVEAFEKDWGYETIGKIQLEKGDFQLKMTALKTASGEVAEVKGLIVKRL
ncbi:MAG: arylsulfatase [Cyclobacteriaceae bacterium]|nr:arylsulfatase [Cyclobacteriaceae bacterium]